MTQTETIRKTSPTSPTDVEARLLTIVRDTFVELRRESAERGRVTLGSSLDRDLGFDSLARVELLLRIEQAFDTHLGEEVLSSAETPADLLGALQRALRSSGKTQVQRAAAPIRSERADEPSPWPDDAATLIGDQDLRQLLTW